MGFPSFSNPGVNTVEGEIFDALVKAACISADNSTNPGKVSNLVLSN